MRSCDLYDIVWFVLKERLITILIMFSRDKADVQYGRDRKSEIAFFRKKKKNSVTDPVILKDTLKIKTKILKLPSR